MAPDDVNGEAGWAESTKEMLIRIRAKDQLAGIPDDALRQYIATFKNRRETLNQLIRRPKDPNEAKLMAERTDLKDKFNLIIGTLEGELARRGERSHWSF